MNDLKSPNELASGSAKSNDGVCPLIVAETNAAEVVRAGAASGNKNQVVFGIDGERGPGIAGAGAWRGGVGPGNRIPGPAKFAGTGVESTHDAAADVYFPIV